MKFVSTREVIVFCPAKINILLGITGLRKDGFHNLVSLIAKVDFGDNLSISLGTSKGNDLLECNTPNLDCGPSNLIMQAVAHFRQAFPVANSLKIKLEKQIPVGAGLGGGSSNAAGTLNALNTLFGSPLPPEKLNAIAATIGSDCPLFLNPGAVIVRGRGELVEPLSPAIQKLFKPWHIALFKPEFPISTPAVYKAFRSLGSAAHSTNKELESKLNEWINEKAELTDLLSNNLEQVVCNKYLGIAETLNELRDEHAIPCRLSGSGSACFALTKTKKEIDSVKSVVQSNWGIESFFVECGFV